MDQFAENLARLLGVHHLDAKKAAALLGMSESAFTKWATGKRRPSFETAMRIGDFFQVPPERLARTPFQDLLANELADPERFRVVENMIAQATGQQRGAVRIDIEDGEPKVTAIDKRRSRKGAKANG